MLNHSKPKETRQSCKHPIITCESRGRKFILRNPGRRLVEIIVVDEDPEMKWVGKKCDFLLKVETIPLYLIELKGCEVLHAIAQLEATIQNIFKTKPTYITKCFIVSSQNPLVSTKNQAMQLKFKKQYNASLCIRTNLAEDTVA